MLFVGIVLFAIAIALLRSPGWLRVVAAVVAVTGLLRLTLEVVGRPRGVLDALAPLTFLVLVAALTWLSFRGHRISPVNVPREVLTILAVSSRSSVDSRATI